MVVATANAAESGRRCSFPPTPLRVLKVAKAPEHNRRMTMPYHADVIGSLLRPHYLVQARAALAAGQLNNGGIQADRGSRGRPGDRDAGGLRARRDQRRGAAPLLLPRSPARGHGGGRRHARRAGALPRPGSGAGLGLAPADHRHRPAPAQGPDDDHRGVQLRARPGPRPGEDHDAEPAGHVRRVVTGTFPPGLLRPVRAVRRRRRHHPRRGARTGPARLYLHPDRLARPRHAGGPGEPRAA